MRSGHARISSQLNESLGIRQRLHVRALAQLQSESQTHETNYCPTITIFLLDFTREPQYCCLLNLNSEKNCFALKRSSKTVETFRVQTYVCCMDYDRSKEVDINMLLRVASFPDSNETALGHITVHVTSAFALASCMQRAKTQCEQQIYVISTDTGHSLNYKVT